MAMAWQSFGPSAFQITHRPHVLHPGPEDIIMLCADQHTYSVKPLCVLNLNMRRRRWVTADTHSHIKISRCLTGGELSCIHIHTNPHIHTILTHIQIQQGTHTTGWFSRTVAYTY